MTPTTLAADLEALLRAHDIALRQGDRRRQHELNLQILRAAHRLKLVRERRERERTNVR